MLLFLSCKRAQTVYPVKKDIVETVYASGSIVPGNEHWLSAMAGGQIVKKSVKEGDTVKRGQILYVISDEVAQLRYEAALSDYNTSVLNTSDRSPVLNQVSIELRSAIVRLQEDSVNYFRWKNLWDHNIGTRSNLDRTYAAYQLSRNEVQALREKYTSVSNELRSARKNSADRLGSSRKELSNIYVRSDCDCVVYEVLKEEGESVSMGEKILSLGEGNEPEVKLLVDQEDIAKIKTGQMVLFRQDALPDSIYEGTIMHIAPAMLKADQAFSVDARFYDAGRSAFMQSAVEANIIVGRKDQALVLPRSAMAGSDSCWVEENGKAKKIRVQTGISTLDEVEVLSGLNEQTSVVINKEQSH